MAISLVGSLGSIVQSAANTATSGTWGTGETRAAGNLLVCWVMTGGGGNTLPATPSGWTLLGQKQGTFSAVTVFGKIATGGDAAPSIPGAASTNWEVMLGEFTGASFTLSVDKLASSVVTTLPGTITAPAADTAAGELVLICGGLRLSTSSTTGGTATCNNGTVSSSVIASGLNHAVFGYTVTTGNASADSVTFGDSGVTLKDASLLALSLSLATVHADSPTGTIRTGGTLTEANRSSSTPHGATTLRGSITEASLAHSSPSGSVRLSGSVREASAAISRPFGTVRLGGSLTENHGFLDMPTGRIRLSGALVEAALHSSAPSGLIVLEGALAEAWQHVNGIAVVLSDEAATLISLADEPVTTVALEDTLLTLLTLVEA